MSEADKSPCVAKSNKRTVNLQNTTAPSEKKLTTSSKVQEDDELARSTTKAKWKKWKFKSEVNDESEEESGDEEYDEFKEGMPITLSTCNNKFMSLRIFATTTTYARG